MKEINGLYEVKTQEDFMMFLIAIAVIVFSFLGLGLKFLTKRGDTSTPQRAVLFYTGVERRARKRHEPVF